jgi:rhodanese-related sulfurtransferase
MQSITATELAQWLNDGTDQREKPLVLDVREPWEFETASLPGSLHIPMNQIMERVHELDHQAPIVCLCHHGMRSMQVALYLQRQGIENLFNLTGGIDAWSRDVDSSVARY